MIRAPAAPIIASAITLWPWDPAGAPAASSCSPVTPACQPGGAAAVSARSSAWPWADPAIGLAGGVNTSAYVVRPSRVRNTRLPVLA